MSLIATLPIHSSRFVNGRIRHPEDIAAHPFASFASLVSTIAQQAVAPVAPTPRGFYSRRPGAVNNKK
jgi:hypothetical protein